MAKRRICEDKPGRTGEAEVRLDGWGSSLLNESTNSSPQLSAGTLRAGCRQVEQERLLRERVAQVMSRNNRRKSRRLVQSAEIRIQQLSPTPDKPEGAIWGEVKNFSDGGICVESPVPLVTSAVVQCRVGVPDLQFAIPTLMQVLWVEETEAAEYAAGLRYLF